MQHLYEQDFKPLLKLALPLILTGLIGACIGFFETVFLAHLSSEAMAAGALVSWLFGLFVVIIFGTLSAINVLVSYQHGAKDTEKIARVMKDALLLAAISSVNQHAFNALILAHGLFVFSFWAKTCAARHGRPKAEARSPR